MSLRFVLFDLCLFSPGDDVHEARKDLVWLLEALVQRDQDYLKQNPRTPRLYKSGVVYDVPQQFNGDCEEVAVLKKALGPAIKQRNVVRALDVVQQVLGGERFRDIGRIIENRKGDCDNLSTWRVAELRQKGIEAHPWMTHRTRLDGGTTYHALVRWPPFANVKYETSEDPSLLLGMGGASKAAERAEEIRKNAERCDLIKKYGAKGERGGAGLSAGLEVELEDVLGLRRHPRPGGDAGIAAELDKMFGAQV